MKKLMFKLLFLCSLLVLGGCKGKVWEDNTLSVDKKGKITCTIVEDFSKDFYDAEELQEIIDEEIAAYNRNFAQDHLKRKLFEVKEEKAVLQLAFDEAKYYADYAGTVLFQGSVAEALAEGYDLSGECMAADGSLTDLGSMEGAEDLKVLILEEAFCVEVPGKIVCVSRSGNVLIKDKKEAVVNEAQQAFIIYK